MRLAGYRNAGAIDAIPLRKPVGGVIAVADAADRPEIEPMNSVVASHASLLTDVPGVLVGNADDERLRSGVSVVLFEQPATAAVDVRGGAPGTRETDLLALENTVESVDAIVLSGGSAFGLDAASGAMALLRERGRGFAVGPARVPIVPAAILFDLNNGGDKDWGRFPPYRELGYRAAQAASRAFALGSAGAGFGAQTSTLRGGLGSASALDGESGRFVGALVAVNAFGSATVGEGPHFWAAPFEVGAEFGGLGLPSPLMPEVLRPTLKRGLLEHTTIAVVAADAKLTKPQAKRLAVMAQDGLARALHPAHTPLDGDIVFAAGTGHHPLTNPPMDLARLGTLAGLVIVRAIARAVYLAGSSAGLDRMPPAWTDRFGKE
jgi:L-aminopeptidase/D-esterase-like protein